LGSGEVTALRPRLGRAFPLVAILIIVLVLALFGAGLYFGDRFAEHRAEQRAAAALQPRLGTPQPPHVDIEGFPFLTQVASRSIDRVHILADQIGATNEALLNLAHADLVLSDVMTNDWFKTMTISHAEGTALLDYAKLSALAGAPMTYSRDGRVELVIKTRVLGRDVEAVVTGAPRLDVKEQTMTLSDAKISVAGVNLPEFSSQALLAALLNPIPLKGMPLGMTVTRITAAEDGVHVDLVGDNLTVSA
jgi:LmeA-like phospholipid-binding